MEGLPRCPLGGVVVLVQARSTTVAFGACMPVRTSTC